MALVACDAPDGRDDDGGEKCQGEKCDEVYLPYIVSGGGGGGSGEEPEVCRIESVTTSAACPLYNSVTAEVEVCSRGDGGFVPKRVTVTTPDGLPEIEMETVMVQGSTTAGDAHAELGTRMTADTEADAHEFSFASTTELRGANVQGQLYFPSLYDAGHDCLDTFSVDIGEPEVAAAEASGFDWKCDFSRMNCLEVYQSFFGWEHPDTGEHYPVTIVGCVHWDNTQIMGNYTGPTPCADDLAAQGAADVPASGLVGHLNAEFAVCSYQPGGNLKYRGSLADLHSTGWIDAGSGKGCSASYNISSVPESGSWGVGLPEACLQANCADGRDLTDSLQHAWNATFDWFAQREEDIEDWMQGWGIPELVASPTAYVIVLAMEVVTLAALATATAVPVVPPPP